MRDRLVELLKESPMLDVLYASDDEWECVADSLIEEGVILSPCKVGTLVHCVVFLPITGKLSTAKGFIKEINVCENNMKFHIVDCINEKYANLNIWLTLDEFKKFAFWGESAKEEAEKTLAEKGNNNA